MSVVLFQRIDKDKFPYVKTDTLLSRFPSLLYGFGRNRRLTLDYIVEVAGCTIGSCMAQNGPKHFLAGPFPYQHRILEFT